MYTSSSQFLLLSLLFSMSLINTKFHQSSLILPLSLLLSALIFLRFNSIVLVFCHKCFTLSLGFSQFAVFCVIFLSRAKKHVLEIFLVNVLHCLFVVSVRGFSFFSFYSLFGILMTRWILKWHSRVSCSIYSLISTLFLL